MKQPHILLVSFPAFGHFNPCIQLAKNLIQIGARVTLVTAVNYLQKLKSQPSHNGLSLDSYSDGYDDQIDGFIKSREYSAVSKRVGSESLADLIQTYSETSNKVTSVIYSLFLPWVALVARKFNVPSALLLTQSASSFILLERFCNSHDGISVLNEDIDTSFTLKLPGLPSIKYGDIPSYALPKNSQFLPTKMVLDTQLEVLEEDTVLVNTLNGLEPDSIASIKNAVVVGPLVPNPSSSSTGDSYFQWLDSKPDKSVVFVSFGSVAVLSKTQKEELLHGLVESDYPFLLVLRGADEVEEELKERAEDRGLIIEWSSQNEVLRHPAIGCFFTHCGWNSTIESMVAGVAIVGHPQFADQMLNAKMVAEVWGNGVRVEVDETKTLGREEIKRCLKVVMDGGVKAEEIKNKVEKWKTVAMESVKDEGGSSMINLKHYLESIINPSVS